MKASKEFFRKIIEKMIPMHQFLGVQLLEVEEGFVKIRIPYRPELIGDPRKNRIHGGIIAVGMDASGGAAGMTKLTSELDDISTIDMRIDYLRPGKDRDLIFIGKILRSSTRTIVTQMEAYNTGSDKMLAIGKAVFSLKRKQDECNEKA